MYFLALAPEIRNLVYIQYLIPELAANLPLFNAPLPSLLLTNRQIYQEAIFLYYNLNTFSTTILLSDPYWYLDRLFTWLSHRRVKRQLTILGGLSINFDLEDVCFIRDSRNGGVMQHVHQRVGWKRLDGMSDSEWGERALFGPTLKHILTGVQWSEGRDFVQVVSVLVNGVGRGETEVQEDWQMWA